MKDEDSPLAKFGPFVAVFERREDGGMGGYHDLLSLYWDRSATVVEQIASIVEKDDSIGYIRVLLDDPNWRPQIVGAVACLIESEADVLDNIWQAVDAGSWVTPQLCVVAYFIDPQFLVRARDRIEARCLVSPPEGLTPAERHSATGPEGVTMRSAKMLASLLALCELSPPLAGWVRELRADQGIREILDVDESWNKSDRITSNWFNKVTQLFKERGTTLTPKFVEPDEG